MFTIAQAMDNGLSASMIEDDWEIPDYKTQTNK
jgi:hypothetical protein